MKGSFVLQNKSGQTVRTLQWESKKLSVIYRHDNRRIETLSSVKELDKEKIKYSLIAEVTQEEIQKRPLALGNGGTLAWIPEIVKLSPVTELKEEDSKPFFLALKWTSGIQVAAIAICFILGYFLSSKVEPPVEEPTIVRIVERRPIVNMAQEKIKVAPVLANTKQKKNPRIVKLQVARKSTAPKKSQTVALNQVGALSVLGSMSKSLNAGGLNVNAAQVSKGPGLGGNAGSGGVQASIYSRGLIANPLGPNGRANGAGGYGTRGKGGGQAGYGSMTLIGSSNAYFEPVEREALVEGGLDRDQISEVIARHLGEVRLCYEQGLQRQPELSGRVAIKFIINSGGHVTTAQINNTSLRSDQVENCIVRRLKTWQFPLPRGGVNVRVTYPFVLKRTSQS